MGRKRANIAMKKGAADKLRSQIYTKTLFEVTRAVKIAGEDPSSNFLLRVALLKCKKNNVPRDNIQRAIKKGLGGDGDGYSDVFYEGYGPGGVAIFVETSTDNGTRTVANVRFAFSKHGGALGTSGSLQFLFDRKAVFEVLQISGELTLDEDEFILDMIDAGAEEIDLEDGVFTITGEMESFGDIQRKLEELGVTPEEASLERIPTSTKAVSGESLEKNLKLIDALNGDEDVISVYHNMELPEES